MTKAKRTEKLSIRMRAEGVRKRTGDLLSQAEELLTGRRANRQTAAKKKAGQRQRNARRRQGAAKQTAARRRSKGR